MTTNQLECVICLNRIQPQHKVWICQQCFNLSHLACINNLLSSNNCIRDGNNYNFRCPQCNLDTVCENRPKQQCYCARQYNPEPNEFALPHSCDQECNRKSPCGHPCPLLCHPGPCPPCTLKMDTECQCGKKTMNVQCVNSKDTSCLEICAKVFEECKGQSDGQQWIYHTCPKICHKDSCGKCETMIDESCKCGDSKRTITCSTSGEQICEKVCGTAYKCGVHSCSNKCCSQDHSLTNTCQFDVELNKKCKCGKTSVENPQRQSCSDPLPSCNQVCSKSLDCGHSCILNCHDGLCKCDKECIMKCKCEETKISIKCEEIVLQKNFNCEEVCKTSYSCGVHKCENKCCPLKPFGSRAYNLKQGLSHLCADLCHKELRCGHECGDMCHKGECKECSKVTSNVRLQCNCKSSQIDPPIKCGITPPVCLNKCNNVMNCGHTCHKYCHFGECTKCSEMIEVPCQCTKSEVIVKCYERNIKNRCKESCGLINKCGHKCSVVCHDHKTDMKVQCNSKCFKYRQETCQHLCARDCHFGVECVELECNVTSAIFCKCRNLFKLTKCRFKDMQQDNPEQTQFDQVLQLPCNDTCQVEERDRKLTQTMNLNVNRIFNPMLDDPSEYFNLEWLELFTKQWTDVLKSQDYHLDLLLTGKLNTYVTEPVKHHRIIEVLFEYTYKYWNINVFMIDDRIQVKRHGEMQKPILSLWNFRKFVKTQFNFDVCEKLLNPVALKRKEIDQNESFVRASLQICNLTPYDREEHLKEKLKPINLDNRFKMEWIDDHSCQVHFKFDEEATKAHARLVNLTGTFNMCELIIHKVPIAPDERLRDRR